MQAYLNHVDSQCRHFKRWFSYRKSGNVVSSNENVVAIHGHKPVLPDALDLDFAANFEIYYRATYRGSYTKRNVMKASSNLFQCKISD